MLKEFFEQLARTDELRATHTPGCDRPAPDGLAAFFKELANPSFRPYPTMTSIPSPTPSIVANHFSSFLAQLDSALTTEYQAGAFFDPWEAMQIGRKEVRCCEILMWLLNPAASHGFGTRPLDGLLTLLRSRQESQRATPVWSNLPDHASDKCSLRSESPESSASLRRIDISIKDPGFEIIIEAKVGAREGENQILSYCEKTHQRLGSDLPWLLIFLTHDGREPDSAGSYKDSRVVPMAWKELAYGLSKALEAELHPPGDQLKSGILARNYFVRAVLRNMVSLTRGRK